MAWRRDRKGKRKAQSLLALAFARVEIGKMCKWKLIVSARRGSGKSGFCGVKSGKKWKIPRELTGFAL